MPSACGVSTSGGAEAPLAHLRAVTAPSPVSSGDPLGFAERLLALLETGRKTATYKFATLCALIDACTERAPGPGDALEIPGREIGERVFEMLWRQAVPFSGGPQGPRFLRHSVLPGNRPDLVVKIQRFRQSHHLLSGITPEQAAARLPDEVAALREEVVVTVIRMPLPKLQRYTVGGRVVEDRFVYDYGWPDEVPAATVQRPGFDDTLRLRPGVGSLLARVGALLRPVIEARWAAFVADRSHGLVESADVAEFLFGADRVSLAPVRAPLVEIQRGRCFYCQRPLRVAGAEVDHFVPWVRHPDNGIENLVATDASCNAYKRDSMAALGHLERWMERNEHYRADLADVAANRNWPRHSDRTLGAARATYLWLPEGTSLWLRGWQYELLDRQALMRVLGSAA